MSSLNTNDLMNCVQIGKTYKDYDSFKQNFIKGNDLINKLLEEYSKTARKELQLIKIQIELKIKKDKELRVIESEKLNLLRKKHHFCEEALSLYNTYNTTIKDLQAKRDNEIKEMKKQCIGKKLREKIVMRMNKQTEELPIEELPDYSLMDMD